MVAPLARPPNMVSMVNMRDLAGIVSIEAMAVENRDPF